MKPLESLLGNERDTGRLEAFSDGVFAVAITLMLLNIQVTPVRDGLLNGLRNTWPSYLGYVTSFLIIGLFWANHHYMFKYINRTDHFLLLLNVLVLMVIVLIPFATELLTAFIHSPDRRYAAVIYSGVLLLSSVMYNVLWHYASDKHRLLDKALSPDVLRRLTQRYLISVPLYAVTVIIAAFNVELSIAVNIVLALFYALPATLFQFGRSKEAGVEEKSNDETRTIETESR